MTKIRLRFAFGLKRSVHLVGALLLLAVIVGCRMAPSATAEAQIGT